MERAISNPKSQDNLKLYLNGDAFFESLFKAIAEAKNEVFCDFYIVDNDQIGQEFRDLLDAAARRGVDVRLIVDGIGSQAWIEQHVNKLSLFEWRVYHPTLLSSFFYSRRPIYFQKLYSLIALNLSRLNRRNHRKFVAIDGNISFIGSRNISAHHSEKLSSSKAWLDADIEIYDKSLVFKMIEIFQFVWNQSKNLSQNQFILPPVKKRESREDSRFEFRSNHTLIRRIITNRNLSKAISTAKERIWIINPYFSPPPRFLKLLALAAQRGVDVQLLTSRKSDVVFMPWVARAHYDQLLRSGVKVFEYQEKFIHTKCLMLDNRSILGSTNLNRRSIYFDLELDLVIQDPAILEKLEEYFLSLQKQCLPIRNQKLTWDLLLGHIILFIFGKIL